MGMSIPLENWTFFLYLAYFTSVVFHMAPVDVWVCNLWPEQQRESWGWVGAGGACSKSKVRLRNQQGVWRPWGSSLHRKRGMQMGTGTVAGLGRHLGQKKKMKLYYGERILTNDGVYLEGLRKSGWWWLETRRNTFQGHSFSEIILDSPCVLDTGV